MLKVLHVSAWDRAGGSGRSAYRIHDGLRRLGLSSRMLVGQKATAYDPDVGLVSDRWWLRAADWAADTVTDRLSYKYYFYPSSYMLNRRRSFCEADIVQLYNIHGGYFSYRALPRLAAQKPVVWRLSDIWPMTGHCTYSYDCERWMTGCGSCPRLSDYPGLRRDKTAWAWKSKKRVYSKSDITIVGPSRWIVDLAKRSPLLGRFPVHHIPNGLDTEVFKPIPKPVAREILGINPDRRIVFFSADTITSVRKGAQILTAALERLVQGGLKDVELLTMGGETKAADEHAGFPAKHLGHIKDDITMSLAYSAADVFVLPTLQDNLPNGLIESMACGTPAISFDVGGVADAVRHMETGYLAKCEDVEDLAHGIRLIIGDQNLRARMMERCRQVVLNEYSLELQSKSFFELYCSLAEERSMSARLVSAKKGDASLG